MCQSYRNQAFSTLYACRQTHWSVGRHIFIMIHHVTYAFARNGTGMPYIQRIHITGPYMPGANFRVCRLTYKAMKIHFLSESSTNLPRLRPGAASFSTTDWHSFKRILSSSPFLRIDPAQPDQNLHVLLHGLDRNVFKPPMCIFVPRGQIRAGKSPEGKGCTVGSAAKGF